MPHSRCHFRPRVYRPAGKGIHEIVLGCMWIPAGPLDGSGVRGLTPRLALPISPGMTSEDNTAFFKRRRPSRLRGHRWMAILRHRLAVGDGRAATIRVQGLWLALLIAAITDTSVVARIIGLNAGSAATRSCATGRTAGRIAASGGLCKGRYRQRAGEDNRDGDDKSCMLCHDRDLPIRENRLPAAARNSAGLRFAAAAGLMTGRPAMA